MFRLHDTAGALLHALEPFHRRGIGMSKIESRRSRQEPADLYFFADIDGHSTEAELQAALEELQQHCSQVKVLGTYPRLPAA